MSRHDGQAYARSQAEVLRDRTKRFALLVIKLSRLLPRTPEARVVGTQLLHSATSIASNYRATCRARSKAEFLAKMGVVVEEADETVFWLEVLIEGEVLPKQQVDGLLEEANQLVAIFSASRQTARQNSQK